MPTPINISASRGAAILGLSSWRTPVQTWLEIIEAREPGFCAKNNYELPVFEYTPAMRWGHAFESAIVELAEIKRGIKITNREKFYGKSLKNKTSKKNILTCYIDGCYENFTDLHEGKTTSAFYFRDNFGEPGTDQVPIEYQIQCQHQMICTGAEKVILSVLVFPRRVEEWEEIGTIPQKNDSGYWLLCDSKNNDTVINEPMQWAHTLNQMGYFHQYEICAHAELQNLMIFRYKEFWENHVLNKIPPNPKTYDDIRALVREPFGTIIADDNITSLMSEYKNIKSEIGGTGSLAKRADQIKIEVLNWMRTAGAVIDDESEKKWILRDSAGKKIGSYGKNKNGVMIFK